MKNKAPKHTRSPWTLGYHHRRTKVRDHLAFVNAGAQTVAKCDGENALANARLICAAPEMHAALLDWVAQCDIIDAGIPKYVLAVLKKASPRRSNGGDERRSPERPTAPSVPHTTENPQL